MRSSIQPVSTSSKAADFLRSRRRRRQEVLLEVRLAYDSIQMYLKEIGQYPLISGGMEKELAKRIEQAT
jgi:hypothetical protein